MKTVVLPEIDAALTNDLVRRFQASWESLQSLAINSDRDYILKGVIDTGGSVSAGWVVIGGELLEFKAGTRSDYIVIKELETEIVVGAGSYKEVDRWVEFGTGTGQILFSRFAHKRSDDGVFQKEYSISDWDMTADAIKTVSIGSSGQGLGGIQISEVLRVSVIIKGDDGVYSQLERDGYCNLYAGSGSSPSQFVEVNRGDSFNDANYSSTGLRATVLVSFK